MQPVPYPNRNRSGTKRNTFQPGTGYKLPGNKKIQVRVDFGFG